MKAKVSPKESVARNARRSVGAVSSTFSWKNSIGKLSWPGTFPLGSEVMVFATSSRDNS
jgi:hypothetical protein